MSNKTGSFAFTDGFVYSPGFTKPLLLTIVVDEGKIVFAGSADNARPFVKPGTEVVNCKDRLILPGFQDSHIHPLIGAEDLISCSLTGLNSIEDYIAHIKDYSCRHADKSFISGSGWIYGLFPPEGPNKNILDAVEKNRPIFLKAFDGHSAWVNSKALEMAGITNGTSDPDGGRIERNPLTGEATGVLREWPAMNLVFGLIPKTSKSELVEGARHFFRQAARYGITSIHDARGKERFMDVYSELAGLDELQTRLSISLFCDPKSGVEQIQELEITRKKYARAPFEFKSVKIFLDGVMEGHTAFLNEPYADRPNDRGSPIWDPAHLIRVAREAHEKGWQMHFHAVGDGAVRLALDAIESAVTTGDRQDRRHQIAHADLIAATDIARFAELKAIANFQPAWFYKDRNFIEISLPQLGSKRANGLYAVKDVVESGGKIAFSSDWPFGGDYITFNPLEAIQIGLTRKALNLLDETLLGSDQRIDLKGMLDAYTIGSAYAEFRDLDTGSLDVGKKADLIIVSNNLFDLRPEEIAKTEVLFTMLDGKPIWSA